MTWAVDADRMWDELAAIMAANLHDPKPSHVVPLLIHERLAPNLEPDWNQLTQTHPHIRETGVLVIPDELWPDPTTPTYNLGAFFAAPIPPQP